MNGYELITTANTGFTLRGIRPSALRAHGPLGLAHVVKPRTVNRKRRKCSQPHYPKKSRTKGNNHLILNSSTANKLYQVFRLRMEYAELSPQNHKLGRTEVHYEVGTAASGPGASRGCTL